MSSASLCRNIALKRFQLGHRRLYIAFPGLSEFVLTIAQRQSVQRRSLLTAVTNSPRILNKYTDDIQPPPFVLTTVIDAGLSWVAQGHCPDDPPSHAIVLVNKSLIPRGKDELLQALHESTQLSGLNAVVAAVDSVGEGAKGVSVLLASQSEGITINSLEGIEKEEIRVGKWHAKDIEKDEPVDFDTILASVRGQTTVEAAPSASRSKGSLVFVLGEMEGMQSLASQINSNYPSADIV